MAVVLIEFPEPEAAPQLAPEPVAAQVQVTPVSAAGTESVTNALVAVDGPALATEIV